LARKECPHEVRNELIAGPIAAPNSIPGASAGNGDVVAIKRLGREDSVISSNLSCNSMACTNPICDYSQQSEALRVSRIDIEIHDRDAAPPFHRTAKFCISLNGLATTRVGLFQPFG
jgi:hypothetical protein